jgi:hypothetical protein
MEGITNAVESTIAPAPTAAMPVVSTLPTIEPTTSSSSSSSLMDMLKGINLIELGFGILGTATLYYTIYYYRFNMSNTKAFKLELENKIDELKIQVSDLSSALQRSEKEREEQMQQQQQNSTWM